MSEQDFSSGRMRRLHSLRASCAAFSPVSSCVTPTSTHNPGPAISPTVSPSTTTFASLTRWATARMPPIVPGATGRAAPGPYARLGSRTTVRRGRSGAGACGTQVLGGTIEICPTRGTRGRTDMKHTGTTSTTGTAEGERMLKAPGPRSPLSDAPEPDFAGLTLAGLRTARREAQLEEA